MGNISVGAKGESFAVELLLKNGYKILTRNYRTKVGEIDIIAVDHDTLVFVEVKTRNSSRFGQPIEAVTARKQATIQMVAQKFIKEHSKLPKKYRIDVVSVYVNNETFLGNITKLI
jgi:putative endonuclease